MIEKSIEIGIIGAGIVGERITNALLKHSRASNQGIGYQ